jgi:hypothetical protein
VEPFKRIAVDGKTIGGFAVVSYITLMGSSKGNAGNVLDRHGKLEVCIRLTKCTHDDAERISYDLDKFMIDTADEANIIYDDACVPYLNYKRISRIGKIEIGLPEPRGSYVIKILLKEPGKDKYTVQSLHHLEIQ